MDDTKQYEVVEEITLNDEVKATGEKVDLTEEQAAEFGEKVKLVESAE